MALKSTERRVDELELNKQDILVSGVTIKTINGNSVLGSGNLTVGGSASWGSITGTLSSQTDLQSALDAKQDDLISGTNIKTINSTSLLGSGDVAVQPTLVSGTNIKTINGTSLLGSGDITVGGGITVGTTAVTSGTDGRVFFQAGGVVQQDSAFFWDNTNKRLGIGATPSTSVRLDVRAQGALSTDIAFRVRNSADTANLYSIDGLGNVIFNASSGANPFIWNHAGTLQMKLEVAGNSGLLRVYNNGVLRHDIDGRDYASFKGIKINGVGGGVNFLNIGSAVSNSKFNVDIAGDPILDVFNSTNLNVIRFDSRGGEGAIQVRTVSSPTTSIVDGFKQYSADIVAGNAAPHFRTENGNIIKLFRGAALTSSDGTLANAVTRIAELEARLQAHGLIA